MNSPKHTVFKLSLFSTLIGSFLIGVGGLHAAGTLSAGNQFGGSVDADGILRTWGLNDQGQLGRGVNTTPLPAPEKIVSAAVFSGVEAGPNFMFGITTGESDNLFSWGNNSFGQLGINSTVNNNTPQSVNFPGTPKISDVAAGTDHALALDATGRLYAWGNIANGQLGLGVFQDPQPENASDTIVETPLQVGSAKWIDIAAGDQFSIAVRDDNTLWFWGAGVQSLGFSGDYLSPVQVPGSSSISWSKVEAGNQHVIALTRKGHIYTWGNNDLGQLGLANQTPRTSPTKVGTASNWVSISTGSYQSYAINSLGELYGWGMNSSEQLGINVIYTPPQPYPTNYFILSPSRIGEPGTFSAVDGGRDIPASSGTLPDGTELIGFTVMGGTYGSEGIFAVGGNVSGQLGTGSTSFSTSYIPQRTAADGLSVSITAPEVDEAIFGVNATITVSMTVSNSGSVPVTEDYTVELYLSNDDSFNVDDEQLLASLARTDTLPLDTPDEVSFTNVVIPDAEPGEYYLISRVSFLGEDVINASETTTGFTAITITRPDLTLSNLNFADGTAINFGENFTNVSLELTNSTIGIVPDGKEITIDAYLVSNLEFDPTENAIPSGAPQLIPDGQRIYSEGLNAFNAGSGATPPVSVSLDFSELNTHIPENSREYFLIVFVVNKGGTVDEESGVTENNYISQRVRIISPASVPPAIGFGNIVGEAGASIGRSDEWRFISDTLALNGDSLQSPVLAVEQTRTMSMEVYGPTFISAPWLINAGPNGKVEYTLKAANTNDILEAVTLTPYSQELNGFMPNYQTVEIVIDADSDLYEPGDYPYPWTITWKYTQDDIDPTGYARVDLEVPNFVPDANSFIFLGVPDDSSPLGDSSVVSTDGTLAAGDSAVMNLVYNFTDSALVTFWWRTNGVALQDTLTFSVDGVVRTLPTSEYNVSASSAVISGNTGWQQVAFIISPGPHTLRWTFNKRSTSVLANAFIDGLQVLQPLPDTNIFNRTNPDPALVPTFIDVPGDWVVIDDSTAPNDAAVEVTALNPIDSASFSYNTVATGPTVIYAPWQISSIGIDNTLSYTLTDGDGDPIFAPDGTTVFTEEISGNTNGYLPVNIVINADSPLYGPPAVDPGDPDYTYPWTITWTYTQNSLDVDAFARVAPTPYNFDAIPISNVDMSIETVVLTTGTYILDDANGTGRLPISVSVMNRGADFNVGDPNSTADTFIDPTNLSVHLSVDQIYGNSDDVNLGNFSQANILNNGNQLIFESELNLPFTTPAGNYYVLLRFDASAEQGEFTLANNSNTTGPGFIIVRAPNLVIRNQAGFSSTYPYRPEQTSYIEYDITNTGLGTITQGEPFSVRVVLYAIDKNSEDLISDTVVKEYAPISHSLFLPEVSAQFPEGGKSHIVHQLELPSARDILVAIGAVEAGSAEDSNEVYQNLSKMADSHYFFNIFVDINDDILESSESNQFLTSRRFNIVPAYFTGLDSESQTFILNFENYGIYSGQRAFSTYTVESNLADSSSALIPGFPNITSLLAYALGLDPTPGTTTSGQTVASTPPLYRPDYENGLFDFNIPPLGQNDYLTMTFDFNVRASDIIIEVQAGDDLLSLAPIVTLTPPYTDIYGPQSLTGFNGLLYNPRVVALEGNVSDVQSVYTARITVRDVAPYTGVNSRFMRLVVTPIADEPLAPTSLGVALSNDDSGGVELFWNGVAYDESDPTINGAFQIERSNREFSGFDLIGTVLFTGISGQATFLDSSVESERVYSYRVRAVSAGGVSDYSNTATITVP
ncbi:hypothetical protein [Cerasicoccus arenae]|uniref:Fibronectin type-III domain-containing protein n=1 Tax=Cerasicoccus arenae TaxID=424488 RepID=A0A8J3DFP0_9BACT|nr:hypothetical protein [Cerasicoccus arenae]MBK1859304.1 hypothetical protein [Cerasicoccus arenae]GHB94279.1 hypothetical protein GCM10007047_07450 [Cerasicoccus arenae]